MASVVGHDGHLLYSFVLSSYHHLGMLDRHKMNWYQEMAPSKATIRLGDEMSCDNIHKPKEWERKRSVAFALSDRVYAIPHINDLDEDEIHNAWWGRDDYACFKGSCRATVHRMNELGVFFEENDDNCIRGLEHFEIARHQTRKMRRAAAAKLVLQEQELQHYEGCNDPEFISEMYAEISVQCQREAHLRGLQDERERSTLQSLSPITRNKPQNSDMMLPQHLSLCLLHEYKHKAWTSPHSNIRSLS